MGRTMVKLTSDAVSCLGGVLGVWIAEQCARTHSQLRALSSLLVSASPILRHRARTNGVLQYVLEMGGIHIEVMSIAPIRPSSDA